MCTYIVIVLFFSLHLDPCQLLGETGQVLEYYSDGMVMVTIKGTSYLFRPIYLQRISVSETCELIGCRAYTCIMRRVFCMIIIIIIMYIL